MPEKKTPAGTGDIKCRIQCGVFASQNFTLMVNFLQFSWALKKNNPIIISKNQGQSFAKPDIFLRGF